MIAEKRELFCFVLFCFVLFCFVLFCFVFLSFSYAFAWSGAAQPLSKHGYSMLTEQQKVEEMLVRTYVLFDL